MNIRISCKGTTPHSKAIEQHAQKQLLKITHFLEKEHGPITITLVADAHPTHAHNSVHLHITTPALKVDIQREGKDIYMVLDDVLHTAYDDLLKQKDRLVDDKKHRPKTRDV